MRAISVEKNKSDSAPIFFFRIENITKYPLKYIAIEKFAQDSIEMTSERIHLTNSLRWFHLWMVIWYEKKKILQLSEINKFAIRKKSKFKSNKKKMTDAENW